MTSKRPFDPTVFLDDEALVAEYPSQPLAEGDTDEVLETISRVARARSMSVTAEQSWLTGEGLYKALRPGGVAALRHDRACAGGTRRATGDTSRP